MGTRHQTEPVKLSAFVTPAEDAAIVQEAKLKRRISKQDWVAEAIRAHLKNSGFEPAEDTGPLAGLSPADQRRVLRYVELLKAVPDDQVFRVAVDANFDLFERAIGR